MPGTTLIRLITLASVSALLLVACATAPDDARASKTFSECLTRNGIQAENVEVTMAPEGYIEEISLAIVDEGSVAYDPTVRVICTEEVEAGQ